jgi:dephospho-CoA kinase
MKVIGLTGGIASGKSTVAVMLASLGVKVIDADQISRQILTPDEPAYLKVLDAFGKDILNDDGTVNRTMLGKIVFADIEKRKLLEAITHPAIRRKADEQLDDLKRAGTDIVVYMAPLLVESGSYARMDEVWVVDIDRMTQLERLMERDGISREEAARKIDAQMPIDVKCKFGNIIIDNRGSYAELEVQIKNLWQKMNKKV